jgi:hypothetical protein
MYSLIPFLLFLLVMYIIFVIYRSFSKGFSSGYKGESLFICANCGFKGNSKTVTNGSFLIEVFLWIMLIIPGMIYSLWRMTSKYKACPKCNAPNMVPMDSPRGKKLEAEFKEL